MKSTSANINLIGLVWLVSAVIWSCLCTAPVASAQSTAPGKPPAVATATIASARSFDTPQQAVDLLIDAADKFDVVALGQIFGPDGDDIVFSGEFPQDRKHAADFVDQAREKEECFRGSEQREPCVPSRRQRRLAVPRAACEEGTNGPSTPKRAGKNFSIAALAPTN